MDVSFPEEKRFVRAELHGQWNVDDFSRAVEKVLAVCRTRKRRLLLVDFTLLASNSMTLGDRYRMGAEAVRLSKVVRRVAALAPAVLLDPERFGEQVARNRGLNVRAFTEIEKAEKWLVNGDR